MYQLIALLLFALVTLTSQANPEQYARFTKSWEGYSATPYDDAGGASIGYGFHLNRPEALQALLSVGVHVPLIINGGRHFYNDGIRVTRKQARELLLADITIAEADCKKLFPSFDSLPRNARLVIVDLRFNLGPSRFRQFKKFRAAINRRDWNTAAAELVKSKWYNQVGRRSRHHVATLKNL